MSKVSSLGVRFKEIHVDSTKETLAMPKIPLVAHDYKIWRRIEKISLAILLRYYNTHHLNIIYTLLYTKYIYIQTYMIDVKHSYKNLMAGKSNKHKGHILIYILNPKGSKYFIINKYFMIWSSLSVDALIVIMYNFF